MCTILRCLISFLDTLNSNTELVKPLDRQYFTDYHGVMKRKTPTTSDLLKAIQKLPTVKSVERLVQNALKDIPTKVEVKQIVREEIDEELAKFYSGHLKPEMDQQFGEVNNHVGRVESRLTTVESKLTTVESRLATVENRLTKVEVELSGVKDNIQGLTGELAATPSRKEFAKLQSQVNALT